MPSQRAGEPHRDLGYPLNMTVPAGSPSGSAHAPDPEPADRPWRSALERGRSWRAAPPTQTAAAAVGEICPYLTASSGSWRSASPHRQHRCGAVDPPGLLPVEKQRRLCLSVDHASCPAFRAARAGRAAVLAPGIDPTAVAVADAARRPLARTAPIILEQPRFQPPTTSWPFDRGISQAVLIGLMVLAFAAVAISRLGSQDGSGSVASPSVSPSAGATATAEPTPRRTPSPSPSGSAPASVGPSGSAPPPSPSFRATYRVEAGDTLVEIAAEFDTTVAAIQEANGLTGSDLRVGQILNIP